MRIAKCGALLINLLVVAHTFAADSVSNRVEEITVYGSQNILRGNPLTATEGVLTGKQLELRPISRIGELLEFIPGMLATQHSGEGKANQYFLRGFNLDHGTDFAISVDGMPVNIPSHAHGQGYADINFLLTEMVDGMLYRKGPYYAEIGNFSSAGSADFIYRNVLDSAQFSYTVGEHDYQRVFAGNTFTAGDGQLTLAGALTGYAGPWQRDQQLRQGNALIKYFQQTSTARSSLTASLYDNSWDSSDQIPLRAVLNGTLSSFGNIDPTVGGDSHRHSLSLRHEQLLGNGNLFLETFLIDYQLDLFSNFTYFLDDSLRGDQFRQSDERLIGGFNARYQQPVELGLVPGTLKIGLQLRNDNADVGLFKTQRRNIFATVRKDEVKETALGSFISLEQQWTSYFRTATSLRLDHYRFDVNSGLAANSGRNNDTMASPKVNLIFGPWQQSEYFLSYGSGFHSNDARGTTVTVDPSSGDPLDSVPALVKSTGYDAGFRTAAIPNTQISVSLFSLQLDSELVYVGDAGTNEALAGSKRRGIELSILQSPLEWLVVDADLSYTRARFSNAGENNYIPLSVSRTASLGILLDDVNGFSGGLRFRYLGAAPLVEDNSLRSDATFLANLEFSYRFNPRWSVRLDVLNLFDSDDHDISYYYESRLQAEARPVDDIHFHPAEPRAFRIGISGSF